MADTVYDNDYLRRIATRNIAEKEARLFEPRLFCDDFVFDGAQQRVQSHPDTFRNGEKFPIRITHLIMSAQYQAPDEETPVSGDERIVQRYALRIRAHDTYYQNPLRVMLPLWANKPASISDVLSLSQSTWRFDKPVIMGNRDAFEVKVKLLVAPDDASERVSVIFDGVGYYTRQPKRLAAFIDLTTLAEGTLPMTDLRNDGTEPFEVHTMTMLDTPPTDQVNPIGNIRNVQVRVRLVGNGTNQWWISRASDAITQLAPAQQLGTCTSRAIVHRLPGDGWLWYPNEQVNAEMETLNVTRTDTLLLAMAGYIMVM